MGLLDQFRNFVAEILSAPKPQELSLDPISPAVLMETEKALMAALNEAPRSPDKIKKILDEFIKQRAHLEEIYQDNILPQLRAQKEKMLSEGQAKGAPDFDKVEGMIEKAEKMIAILEALKQKITQYQDRISSANQQDTPDVFEGSLSDIEEILTSNKEDTASSEERSPTPSSSVVTESLVDLVKMPQNLPTIAEMPDVQDYHFNRPFQAPMKDTPDKKRKIDSIEALPRVTLTPPIAGPDPMATTTPPPLPISVKKDKPKLIAKKSKALNTPLKASISPSEVKKKTKKRKLQFKSFKKVGKDPLPPPETSASKPAASQKQRAWFPHRTAVSLFRESEAKKPPPRRPFR